MDLETLKIDLKGLKEGANHLTFDLDDTYFKAIDAPEVSQGRVHVSLDIVRTGNDFFTLDFHETGMVLVPCDICLELMEQPIETTQRLEVRLGTEKIHSSRNPYQACACTWKMQPCYGTSS